MTRIQQLIRESIRKLVGGAIMTLKKVVDKIQIVWYNVIRSHIRLSARLEVKTEDDLELKHNERKNLNTEVKLSGNTLTLM